MLLITTVVSNQTMAYFAKRFNLNENVGSEVSFVCWIVLIFLHKCFSRHTSNKISKQYLFSEVNFFFLPGISYSKNDKQQLSYEMFLCLVPNLCESFSNRFPAPCANRKQL